MCRLDNLLNLKYNNNNKSRHQALVCPRALVACSLAPMGCDQRLTRGEVRDHMESEAGHHMRLLADKVI